MQREVVCTRCERELWLGPSGAIELRVQLQVRLRVLVHDRSDYAARKLGTLPT